MITSETHGAGKYIVRPASTGDMEQIAAVINAHSQEVIGVPRALIDADRRLRLARYVPDDAEKLVAVFEDRVVGFEYLDYRPPYVAAAVGGAVHPDFSGQGIGTFLMRHVEQRVRDLLSQAPPEAQVVLQSNVFETDRRGRDLLAGCGLEPVRRWLYFEVELNNPPAAPILPEGIVIRRMNQSKDWPTVGAALDEAMADHWGEVKLSLLPPDQADEEEQAEGDTDDEDSDDPYSNSVEHCFVACHGEQVVGSCLGNARSIERTDTGKIGSISVLRPYRRRGIARALMLRAFNEYYRRGVRRIILDTDSESFTGAPRLYRKLGMSIFRREYLYEKTLRTGEEWRILSPADLTGYFLEE